MTIKEKKVPAKPVLTRLVCEKCNAKPRLVGGTNGDPIKKEQPTYIYQCPECGVSQVTGREYPILNFEESKE